MKSLAAGRGIALAWAIAVSFSSFACNPIDLESAFQNVNPLHPDSLCINRQKDTEETDVDCGGPCPGCPDGKSCHADLDCQSETCLMGSCAGCADGVQNRLETSIDCGGSDCSKCADGRACAVASDCIGEVCYERRCASCTNQIQDGSEIDVDCGDGSNQCPGCESGKLCYPIPNSGNRTGCAEGLPCNDGLTPARCGPHSQLDEACGTCVEGLTCNTGFDPPRCRPRGAVGEVCRFQYANTGESHQCQPGLLCNQETTPGQCQPLGAVGAWCISCFQCAEGLACADGRCAPKRTQGQSCDSGDYDFYCDCAPGLGCNTGYTTPACLPPNPQGEACRWCVDCALGLTCRFENEDWRTCEPGTASGVSCTIDCDCGSHDCRSTRTCR